MTPEPPSVATAPEPLSVRLRALAEKFGGHINWTGYVVDFHALAADAERLEAGNAALLEQRDQIAVELRAFAAWMRENHPGVPCFTPDSIADGLMPKPKLVPEVRDSEAPDGD